MGSTAVAIDTRAAEAYDQYLVPPVFGPWAQFVVDLAEPRADEHVLDLACGTGAVTTRAAKHAARVIGIDTDAGMIEIARRNSGYDDHIAWRHGDACQLDFEPATFDVCFCVQGLQHFADRHSALRHVLRVLKPTGRFVAAVWAGVEHTPGLFAVLQELEADGIDPSSFRRPFALGDRGELETLVTCA
jgi:ubiquinone/menaquinone biosynthesis C-methylase UbiE